MSDKNSIHYKNYFNILPLILRDYLGTVNSIIKINEFYKNEIEEIDELLSDFYNITFSIDIEEFEKNRQNKMSLKNLII